MASYIENEIEYTDSVTNTKKEFMKWAQEYLSEQEDFESLRDDIDGITVMRTDENGITYEAERAGKYIVRPNSKLEWVDDWTGLEATYGNGDYTVTVWSNTDWDRDPGDDYELIFCKSNTDIAHHREYISAESLEREMRKYQSDLRKWHKVEYDS